MRTATLTDASMLAALDGFFGAACTIQERTDTADAVGQMVPAWSNLAGHVDIACRIAPWETSRTAFRRQREEMTVSVTAQIIVLAGSYPSVTTAMRAVVDGISYTIVRVLADSESLCTELMVEAVTT